MNRNRLRAHRTTNLSEAQCQSIVNACSPTSFRGLWHALSEVVTYLTPKFQGPCKLMDSVCLSVAKDIQDLQSLAAVRFKL
jgi:hypothetical protein